MSADPMSPTEQNEDVAGTVYGVPLWGRLPAAFRDFLLPPDGAPSRGREGAAGSAPAGEEGGGKRWPVPEPSDGAAEPLEVRYRAVTELPDVDEIWASEPEGPEEAGRFGLFRSPDGFGLTVTFPGRGLFRCRSALVEIEWIGPPSGAAHAFFTYALPLCLEAAGVPVLHGCGLVLGGRAVGFLGRSGVGKSVLCAELMRLGCTFLSDDGLALRRDAADRWWCCAGPPLVRLWPSGLEGRLRVSPEGLPRVHDGLEKRRLDVGPPDPGRRGGARKGSAVPGDPSALESAASGASPGRSSPAPPGPQGPATTGGAPLGALYVLQRRPGAEGPVDVSPCRGPDALARLIEHSLAAAPAAALGLSGRRLDLLTDVVEKTPVRLLRFPSSLDSAARVREAILRDLDDAEGSPTPV